jgi:hypothetical protein
MANEPTFDVFKVLAAPGSSGYVSACVVMDREIESRQDLKNEKE